MTAAISTNYDPKYFYFLPITARCFHWLGIKTICFVPETKKYNDKGMIEFVFHWIKKLGIPVQIQTISCNDNQEATYIQCSRLYASAIESLDPNEVLFTGDVDMLLFQRPIVMDGRFLIWGSDLTPEGQYPICYAISTVSVWRDYMGIGTKSPQQCLDELLGNIDCDNMRGNYWCKDQEELYNRISPNEPYLLQRARPFTQFAERRIDRDDAFWKDRLDINVIDAHLWRPGYTTESLENIMHLLQFMYPMEDFNWVRDYTAEFNHRIP